MTNLESQTRPVLFVAIGPANRADRDRLEEAVRELAQSHSFTIKTRPEHDQIVLGAMSELQLEIICRDLVEQSGIEINRSPYDVVYLETISKRAKAEGKYIRQTGSNRQYAHVKIGIEPSERGMGYEFFNAVAFGAIPGKYNTSIDNGIQTALAGGVLAGFPVVDVKVTLNDASFDERYSNELAFEIAGSMAFKEAARKASPVVLEPIMSVEVTVPDVFIGIVIGDLSSRRGRIESMEHHAGMQVVQAVAPLPELLGYASHLRDLIEEHTVIEEHTECSIRFERYEHAPRSIDFGEEQTGVTANTPRPPKLGRGSGAAELPADAE